MDRRSRLGEIFRPSEPRCADGTSGAQSERPRGVEADPALSGSGTDGRRGSECTERRDAAGQSSFTVVIEHPAGRSGSRTGTARASLLPIRRRLQHLCPKRSGRTEGQAVDHGVSGAKAEVEGQCGQERSGATVGAEVPGLQHDVAQETEAQDRIAKAAGAWRRKSVSRYGAAVGRACSKSSRGSIPSCGAGWPTSDSPK